MRFLPYFRSLAGRFFRRAQIEADLDEELRSHLEHRAVDLERSGLGRAEAERRARIEFGGRERFKEECRDALGGSFLETLWLDARFSLRVLRKTPGFTLVAISTLALAIGANAVVFGVMNAVILRPMNLPRAESLYGIEHAAEHSMYESYPDYRDLRDRNRSFDGLAAFSIAPGALDAGGDAFRVWVQESSGNYFDALGIQPYAGRFFNAGDERGPNSAPYVVLSYGFWHSHFHDDRGVLGRTVQLNRHPYTIVGVTPPEFHGAILFFSPDFYIPMVNQEQVEGRNALEARSVQSVFMVLGHLKSGVTPAQAVADLDSVGSYLERTYPREHGQTRFRLARPGLYGNYLGAPARAFMAGMTLLAGLILLAACANLGSLFAARAADRAREVALRLSLGASRLRILRQLLTEATLIALAGGAAGLWGSIVLLGRLSAWRPLPRFPIQVPVSPDARVYLVALALALVSGLLFGIIPVRQVLRADPYQVVKSGSSAAVSLRRRVTMRDLLLAGQIAICAVLVTSSMVALRGLGRSLHSDFGFDPRNVLLAETDLSMAPYSAGRAPAMQKRMLESVEAIAGVRSSAFSSGPPLAEGGYALYVFDDRTTDLRPSNAVARAAKYAVSPGYFEAARTKLLAGRAFTWYDSETAPRVAVVNGECARKLFGSTAAALGAHFKTREGARVQVVGVAEDGKHLNLTEDPQAAVFLPMLQEPSTETWLFMRTDGEPERLAPAVRAALRALDRGLPVETRTWDRQLDNALFPARVATVALGVLGAMGAILSLTGIFGMAAYSVSRRLKELGIRMALGAQRREVLYAALGRAIRLLAIGSVAGMILGILATRVLGAIVYQATPRDPLVLAGVVLVMVWVGLLATWIPAQRALSLDPVVLLREE